MEKHIQFFFTLISLTFTNLIIADTYKIAFGSCLDQEYPQPIWEAIKNENIDSFIFLGDNVYGDIPSGKLNKMEIIMTNISMAGKISPFQCIRDADFGKNGASKKTNRQTKKLMAVVEQLLVSGI